MDRTTRCDYGMQGIESNEPNDHAQEGVSISDAQPPSFSTAGRGNQSRYVVTLFISAVSVAF